MQHATTEFAEDLDRLRGADDFKDDALPLLIHALQQGTSLFSMEEQKRIVMAGIEKGEKGGSDWTLTRAAIERYHLDTGFLQYIHTNSLLIPIHLTSLIRLANPIHLVSLIHLQIRSLSPTQSPVFASSQTSIPSNLYTSTPLNLQVSPSLFVPAFLKSHFSRPTPEAALQGVKPHMNGQRASLLLRVPVFPSLSK